MQAMSVSQLLQLTKSENFDLRDYLERVLPALPTGSDEREAVEETLRNIERVLARPEFRTCISAYGPML